MLLTEMIEHANQHIECYYPVINIRQYNQYKRFKSSYESQNVSVLNAFAGYYNSIETALEIASRYYDQDHFVSCSQFNFEHNKMSLNFDYMDLARFYGFARLIKRMTKKGLF